MTVRRAVLGDEHVDRAVAATTGAHRAVPGLHHPLRVGRRLDAPGPGPAHPQHDHARAALPRWGTRTSSRCTCARRIRNGLTPEEIGEVLLHTAVYAGVPAANSGLKIAQETLGELGLA